MKGRRLLVSFVIRQNMRAFYSLVGKAGRIFGYAPAVCLCSSMEGKTDNLISFPPFSESVSQSQAKGERQAKL